VRGTQKKYFMAYKIQKSGKIRSEFQKESANLRTNFNINGCHGALHHHSVTKYVIKFDYKHPHFSQKKIKQKQRIWLHLPVNVVKHFLQHLEQTGELLQVERGVDGLGQQRGHHPRRHQVHR
jgi:hypothetical protein